MSQDAGGPRQARDHIVRRLLSGALVALAVVAFAVPAAAQAVDPPADPPTSTEPPSSTEPPVSTEPSTEPPTSTEPGTDPSSTTEPGDPTTSTSEPPTSTTEPSLADLELLMPRPEFGSLTSHQRELVDTLQRSTFTYALRRLALDDTQRQIAAAKGVLARARVAEREAIADEVLQLAAAGSDDTIAGVRALKSRLDAVTRRARAARIRAQDALDALNDQADAQRRAAAELLAERGAAAQGLQDELGPDAVRANPDDVTELLTRTQADQPPAGEVQGIAWPVPGSPLVSPFGLRNDPLGRGAGFHPGVDISASTGTEVHAAAAGRVVRAGDCGGYGLCIVIDHGDHVATLFGHLVQLDVSVGDRVEAGDVIGLVGSTGWSTGSHLHFEVRVDGLPIDPILALGPAD